MANDALKYCPGLIHLRAQLRKLIAAENATQIRVFDGVETTWWGAGEAGVIAAAKMTPDVDGIVRITVGGAALQVIYDGPYSEESASEIINDMNDRASEILDA